MGAKHLSVATVIEKNRIASTAAFVPLLEIDVKNPDTGQVVETLYVARNNEAIDYQGKTYTAVAFDIDIKYESGSTPQISLTMVDYTRTISARMEEYGGGVGFDVRFMVVNADNLDQPPEVVEEFEVITASSAGYVVTFTLGGENPLRKRFPRRVQLRDRCQWRYKGAECKYAGNLPTCDFSLQGPNGCAAHNNTARFGGFSGIKLNVYK